MNKTLITALLLVCGGALCAQGPAAKDAEKKAVTAAPAAVPAPAAQPKKAAKAEVKPAAAKQEEEPEESVVMIDSKGGEPEAEEGGSAAYGAEQEDRTVPGGLPSSYGQCKGTITDAGRTLLVFESMDDGSISFVQVMVGKAAVSWKLVDRIPRSAD